MFSGKLLGYEVSKETKKSEKNMCMILEVRVLRSEAQRQNVVRVRFMPNSLGLCVCI